MAKKTKKPKKRNPIAKAVTRLKPKVVPDKKNKTISIEDYESRLRDYYEDRPTYKED